MIQGWETLLNTQEEHMTNLINEGSGWGCQTEAAANEWEDERESR